MTCQAGDHWVRMGLGALGPTAHSWQSGLSEARSAYGAINLARAAGVGGGGVASRFGGLAEFIGRMPWSVLRTDEVRSVLDDRQPAMMYACVRIHAPTRLHTHAPTCPHTH